MIPDDQDDFVSWVHEKILDGDGRVFRGFSGKSSMRTYLRVVVSNLLRDFRNSRWGKWRPSARAAELGRDAMALERLVYRDGMTVGTAVALVVERSKESLTEREAHELLAELPRRWKAVVTTDLEPEDLPSENRADRRAILESERRRIERGLSEALAELPDEDQLIVKLLYWEGHTVASVARILDLPQKPLYRRMEAVRARLGEALRSRGISSASGLMEANP